MNVTNLMEKEVITLQEPSQQQEDQPLISERYPNPIAITYIFIIIIGLITWTVFICLALFENNEPFYPKPVIGVPLIFLLCIPPIISLSAILFRTFHLLLHPDDTQTFEPLDLIRNESHRQFHLLPLSISGFIMTILPAYYLKYKKYYLLLGTQSIIGLMLLLLFLGIALIPEDCRKGGLNHGLFLTILEK